MEDKEVTQTQQGKVEAAAHTDGSGKDAASAVADSAADIRAAALAETNRIAAIRKVCAGRHADIEAKAIEEGWDAGQTELEVLRAERPKAPAAQIRDSNVDTDVLAAAVCLSGGMKPDASRFDLKLLEAAGRRFRTGIGLQELIMENEDNFALFCDPDSLQRVGRSYLLHAADVDRMVETLVAANKITGLALKRKNAGITYAEEMAGIRHIMHERRRKASETIGVGVDELYAALRCGGIADPAYATIELEQAKEWFAMNQDNAEFQQQLQEVR